MGNGTLNVEEQQTELASISHNMWEYRRSDGTKFA
jgi:hypothetical protein